MLADRQKDKQTARQTDRQTERERDRQTDRQPDGETRSVKRTDTHRRKQRWANRTDITNLKGAFLFCYSFETA